MSASRIAIIVVVLAALGLAFGARLFGNRTDSSGVAGTTPTVDADLTLVWAQPFELAQPMIHTWRAETPAFRRGVIAVIRCDEPALLAKRQTATPLLFWGAETLQVLNDGGRSGIAVAVLPLFGDASPSSLATQPIFFGVAELAERIDAARAAEELQTALAGAPSLPDASLLETATTSLADESALYALVGEAVAAWSPDEADLIAWLRGGEGR